jgi:predicted dehydrogenase/threonine dehydrogenase-like Zn-dependent dehydrogenase
MKQLTQKLKTGNMQILNVPVPNLRAGEVLVRNYYSLISAGTEGSKVNTARKGYIGKAKERPQQVKQVVNTIKEQGIVQTYRAVMKKLDAHSPLGNSCVGEVIDIAPDVREFKIGDLVACGGASASHAEVVCVPSKLCIKLDSGTDLKQAAYNTLGAISMQGVRQADMRLGEICAVIGLGLLGQLTCLFLKASGVKVIGIDISQEMVDVAAKHCADLAINRDTPGIENRINEFTFGYGCDAAIITAASSSLDPINFAGEISRKKGTIVISGAVPTGFDREPYFYQKELTVKMSCSYGPGRYDPTYEEKGHDYPYAYVRWTEKRNMQAFQELIASKRIDVSHLTTHTYSFAEVPKAYDMIIERSEPFIGILIEYDVKKPLKTERIKVSPEVRSQKSEVVNIGFIGAGSYAQSYLLPNIPKNKDVILKGVMTSSSTGSRSVADRFGFEYCTGNAEDILEDSEINTVFIATRHDSHGKYTIDALKAGKNVFVEKPLCLTIQELEEIAELLAQGPRRKAQGIEIENDKSSNELNDRNELNNQSDPNHIPILMVGYNRRFAPLSMTMREKIDTGHMAMLYRINAGTIPADSWIQDPEVGGGRILGEVCHFIDYLTWANGSLPVSVYASVLADPHNLHDTLNVSLRYDNGSLGTVLYFANGSKALRKEYVEIYRHGTTAIIRDFRELEIYTRGKPYRKKLMNQDKGQKHEIKAFIDAILKGGESPIPLDEIYNTSLVTFKILESIRTGEVMSL